MMPVCHHLRIVLKFAFLVIALLIIDTVWAGFASLRGIEQIFGRTARCVVLFKAKARQYM